MTYSREIPAVVNQHQCEALSTPMCILQNFGPLGFLLQEDHLTQKVKVFIGSQHSCSCKEFFKQKELCRHICWVLLKKFKLDKDNPMSWQSGLGERDISMLLQNAARETNAVTAASEQVAELRGPADRTQRPIDLIDICPVCQDEFFSSQRFVVTFCHACGNSVHIKCMKMWIDHQEKHRKQDLNDFVNCPMCRGEFGKIMDLNREILSNKDTIIHKAKLKPREEGSLMNFPRQNEFSAIHPDTYCSDCTFSPIVGRIYELRNHTDSTILNNAKLLLCIKCFERRITCRFESETAEKCSFFWKDKPSDKWLKVPKNFGLIVGFECKVTVKENRSDTYPLSRAELGRLAHWTIRPERRRATGRFSIGGEGPVAGRRGLLAAGRQCRICLMHFREGDEVRRLPQCNHTFHCACVDNWLLHASPYCPLDGMFALLVSSSHPDSPNSESQLSVPSAVVNANLVHDASEILKISPLSHMKTYISPTTTRCLMDEQQRQQGNCVNSSADITIDNRSPCALVRELRGTKTRAIRGRGEAGARQLSVTLTDQSSSKASKRQGDKPTPLALREINDDFRVVGIRRPPPSCLQIAQRGQATSGQILHKYLPKI